MVNPFQTNILDCVLTCPIGLENVTADGISPFCSEILINKGKIAFKADIESVYKINLYSRTGMHLLIKIMDAKAENTDQLYKTTFDYPWHEWIEPIDTFSIRSRIKSKNINNSNYATLKVKDAIVDRIFKQVGNRPNIEKINPRYSLFLFIIENKVNIYLNSSGQPLFKRGYREKIHKASMNEALAAGILLLSKWNKEEPLYDPMCGSGTFSLEAAMLGRNIPPGYYRKEFAFQKWHYFNNRLWNNIKKAAREKFSHKRLFIYGFDNIPANILLSKQNARRILIHNSILFKNAEISDFNPENSGTIIMNPPYGERIGDDESLIDLYKTIGDVLKSNCHGSNSYIFTGNKELIKYIGLKSEKKVILKNGKIDCRLLYYPIREGKYS